MNLIKLKMRPGSSEASQRCGKVYLRLGMLGCLAFLQNPKAMAEDRSVYPGFLFHLNYGMSTTKSKLVASNDTGTSLGYGIGGFAGSSRNLEFNLGFETDSTAFLLNDSKIVYDWQDTKLNYHLGYFYAGAVFSRLNLKVNAQGADTVDAAGSGYGASLGFLTPVGRGGSLRIDVTTVSIATMKNALVTEVSVPSRLDIDIGSAVDIWGKWLDFTFGYRMRTVTVKNASSFSDTETSTYLGLRVTTTN